MIYYSFLQEAENQHEELNSSVVDSAIAATVGTAVGKSVKNVTAYPAVRIFKQGDKYSDFLQPRKLPSYLKGVKVNGEDLMSYGKKRHLKFSEVVSPYGAHFNPEKNLISIPIKDKYADKWGKAIFAHELGHSEKHAKVNGKIPKSVHVYRTSKKLTRAAALSQIINCFNNDDESRQKIGKALSIAGGTSSIPMIAEEIGASMRGTKMLGLKGVDKAKSFVGISSYIVLALSPAIIYAVSERTRKFLKILKKVKDESPKASAKIENLKTKNIQVKI